MLSLLRVKNDLKFNEEFVNIIDVMRGVAAAEFRQLQLKRKTFSRFAEEAEKIFKIIPPRFAHSRFFSAETAGPVAIVLVTSDEGFVGKLNRQVINLAGSHYKPGDELIVLGERGAKYLDEMKLPYVYFPGISEDVSLTEAAGLTRYVLTQYLSAPGRKLKIIWPKFISFAMQRVESFDLLPCAFLLPPEEKVLDIHDLLIEPSWDRVMENLVRMWLLERIYEIFWESKLSEWATRVGSLEAGFDELKNSTDRLRHDYFHFVHELSDRDIREIFASKKLWSR